MTGLIMKSTGSWYEVKADSGVIYKCRLRGKLKLKGMPSISAAVAVSGSPASHSKANTSPLM